MDFQYYWNILARRKWLIWSIVLLSSLLTFFLINARGKVFKSSALLQTGIANYKGASLQKENPFVMEFQIENAFENMIKTMQSRSGIKPLTYRLLSHDLEAAANNGTPFHKPAKDFKSTFSPDDIKVLVKEMRKEVDSISAPALNEVTEEKINKLAKAYGYDYEEILKNMTIKRLAGTDYLNVEFKSEDANLSAYAVREFLTAYIQFFADMQVKTDREKLKFLEDITSRKRAQVDGKRAELTNYMARTSIVNLSEQSKATVDQIKQMELEAQQENQRIPGLVSTIEGLNKYISADNKGKINTKIQSALTNEDINVLRTQLTILQNQYISTGSKDKKLKEQIDLTKKKFNEKISQYAVNEIENVNMNEAAKDQDLVKKKIDAEIELSISQQSVKSINTELRRLRDKSTSMVSSDAFIQSVGSDLRLLEEEFGKMTNEVNIARIALAGFKNPLQIVEYPQIPEKPESSNSIALSAFAGIAGLTLSSLLIFLLSYFDNRLTSPVQFSKQTKLPLLETINQINNKNLDISFLYNSPQKSNQLEFFKESLRKLRYIIESSGNSVFLVVSPKDNEGKTFLTTSLAYSLSLSNKRVLLIDTNFRHNTITSASSKYAHPNTTDSIVELNGLNGEFVCGKLNAMLNVENIDTLMNNGMNHSPSEVLADKHFRQLLNDLKQEYQYIFLEASSINKFADARELVNYADNVIAVFSTQNDIRQSDQNSIVFLRGLGKKFLGSILNKADLKNLS
jgi:polysaccharide biosynthesis transport protein